MIQDTLVALFERHGIAVERREGALAFPDHGYRLSAAVVREREAPDAHAVQLDLRLEIGGARTVVESFVGLGPTREDAVGDALGYFMRASLHPILGGFFERDDPGSLERWRIGGRERWVRVGEAAWRGDPPASAVTAEDWPGALEEALEGVELGPGPHWIRVYYAQTDGVPAAVEVLLDNEPWPEVQEALGAIGWPRGPGFFSLRGFLVVREDREVGEVGKADEVRDP